MPDHPSFQGGADLPAATSRQLGRVADTIARWAVYLSVLLIPLFYLSSTVEGLELNKQALLIVLAMVGTLAWLGKMLVNRHFEFRKSIMNLLLGVYLVIYALSAWFSKSQYVSMVGDYGQEKGSLTTVVCFALLYLVAVNTLKTVKDVKKALLFAMAGGFIAVTHAYLQALGLRVFTGSAAEANSFNLIGTSNALGIYAAAMLAIVMGAFLTAPEGKWPFAQRVLMAILGGLSLLYIASLSFWALWMSLIISGLLLSVYGLMKAEHVKRITMLSIPMAVVVIGVIFSFLRFPVSFGLPAEVMPSMKASWSIARDSLASSPLLGSGPGTFLYDYSQFRSPDLNQTAFWSVGFDRSASRFLTLLATTGILGLAAALVFVIVVAGRTGLRLMRGGSEDWSLTLTVFAGWAALLVGKVLYSSNMTLEFMFWMMTAFLVVLEWTKWHEARFENSPRASLMLSFLFIVAVIFSIAGLYLEGQRYVGELRYASAMSRGLNRVEDVDASIDELGKATALNQQNDLYFRTLSQALALRTNLEIQKIGEKPTQEDSRRVAVLAADAVNIGKRAVDLNPADVRNWSSLAALYSDLAGAVPGAAEAAEEAYAKAIVLEPNNPVHYTDLGKVHLSKADATAQAGAEEKDEAKKAENKTAVDEALSKAKENFDKSIALKSDYAAAHYWLAVTFQRQGKADEALAKLETVRGLSPDDLGIGFQYAILAWQVDQKDKAIAELERLLSLSPQYANARWYLASMYEEQGRLDDAIAQIEEVLKSNPDNEDVKKRLEELKAKKAGLTTPPPAEGLPEPVEPPTEPAP